MLSGTQRLEKSSSHLHHGRETLIQTEVRCLLFSKKVAACGAIDLHDGKGRVAKQDILFTVKEAVLALAYGFSCQKAHLAK